jgi:N-acetylmuramic acid 6-phosphate (MurNAc-6-P) etherase
MLLFDEPPTQKEIREVMDATGCDRKTARRKIIEAMREVRAAEKLLIDALRRGEIEAIGTNTETGRQENIPPEYWRDRDAVND